MTLPRGRVIRGERGTAVDASAASPHAPRTVLPASRVLKGAVAEASLEAARRLDAAERRALEIVASAERDAAATRRQVYGEARAAAEADLAAAWLALRGSEARADELAMERTIELARAMAERLLGEALNLDPVRVVSVARQALATARTARRVVIHAHPTDAQALTGELSSLGLEGASVQIHADEARARGSLYFETDLGTLDAQLTLQLDRLARSLRESRRG
jgi:flagellar biosynthesis/type III secretory pathway protein FliH